MLWRFKGCSRCVGDLILEEDVWKCLQCGHYHYPDVPQLVEAGLGESAHLAHKDDGQAMTRPRYRGREDRDINSIIRAKILGDEKWWARNRQVIGYLNEGRPVREIALLTAKGPRQIRVVRERLNDIRAPVET